MAQTVQTSSGIFVEGYYCSIRGIVDEKEIIDTLQNLSPAFEGLELHACPLTPKMLMKIVFSNLPSIPLRVYIEVPYWEDSDLEKFGILWFASEMKKVRELTVAGITSESSAGLLSFANSFKRSRSKIRALTLRDIKIRFPKSESATYFDLLANSLLYSTAHIGLSDLTLNNIQLGEEGISVFVQRLQNNTTLRRLNLLGTFLKCSPQFYYKIIKQITTNYTLTGIYLDVPLQFTTTKKNSIAALAYSCNERLSGTLRVNKFLHKEKHFANLFNEEEQSLSLIGKEITQNLIVGGLLRQTARLFPNLKKLDLSKNKIQELCCSHFKKLENLNFIDVRDNPLGILSPALGSLSITIKHDDSVLNIPPQYLVIPEGLQQYYEDLETTQPLNRIRGIVIGASRDQEMKQEFIHDLCSFVVQGNNILRSSNPGIEVTYIPSDYDDDNTPEPQSVMGIWNITSKHIFHTCMYLYSTIDHTFYIIFFHPKRASSLLSKLNRVQASAPGAKVFLVMSNTEKISDEKLLKLAESIEKDIDLWKKRMGSNTLKIQRCDTFGMNCIFWPINQKHCEQQEHLFTSIKGLITQEQQIPRKYIALLRFLREKRKTTPSPIVYGSEFRSFARELRLSNSEFNEAMKLLSDWGELIYFPDEHDMIMVLPNGVGRFLELTFADMDSKNNVISVAEIERRWMAVKLDPAWFQTYWDLLFRFDICTRPFEKDPSIRTSGTKGVDSQDLVLVPHLAPKRPKKRKRDRLKSLFTHDISLGRNFVFDFVLPDFTSRLFNRVINEYRETEAIFTHKEEIWSDAVVLELSSSIDDSPVQLVVQQVDEPTESNLFQVTIQIQILVQHAEIQFARQTLGSTSFLIDNFVRDQFPQLHENHMTVYITGLTDRHLHQLLTREECVQRYFNDKIREIDGIPMENLIPEVLNPVSIFEKRDTISEFDPKELVKGEILGTGKSGTVYKAMWRNVEVAWKEFKSEAIDEFLIRDFCQEVSVLCKLNHPNIVRMIGFVLEPNLSLALEFCSGGTLENALAVHERDRSFDWTLLVKIGLDISRALCYLHSQQPAIIHNDLKPDNVMVINLDPDSNACVKLIDFGFSIATTDGKRKDIKSFGSMFDGIISFYCDENHSSARAPVLPTLSHPLAHVNIPDIFKDIISNCSIKYTAERLEFKFSKLWKRMEIGSQCKRALTAGFNEALNPINNTVSVFKGASKNVVLDLLKTTDPETIDAEADALGDEIFHWVDRKDYVTLEKLFSVVNVNKRFTKKQESVLMYACRKGYEKVVKRFLTKEKFPGVDVNIRNERGYSAAHFAVEFGSYECLALLLKANANVHSPTACVPFCEEIFADYQPGKSAEFWEMAPKMEVLQNVNVLECGLFAKRRLSRFSQKGSKVEKRKTANVIENIDRCVFDLLPRRVILSPNSLRLYDRLDLIRDPLLNYFRTCMEGHLERLADIVNLLCSVNVGEFVRVQTMLDTVLRGYKQSRLVTRGIDTNCIVLSRHTIDIKNSKHSIQFASSTLLHDLIAEIIYKPTWVHISLSGYEKELKSFSVKARDTATVYFEVKEQEEEIIIAESKPCVIVRVKKKDELARVVLIHLADPTVPKSPRDESNTNLVNVRESAEGVEVTHKRRKLGGAISFVSKT